MLGALLIGASATVSAVDLEMTQGKPFTDVHYTTLKRVIYAPLASYRIGPYAAGGTGYYGGMIDLFRWVDLKYGGVNGKVGDMPIPIVWEECETEYDTPRGVECYERYRAKGPFGATAIDPLSVGISYALQEKTTYDKIPSITPNHGNTAAQDGRVFPYQFPLQISSYDEASIMIHYVARQHGET